MDSHVTSLLTMTFLPSSFWARYESRNRLLIANKRLPHLRLAMTGVQKRDCYEQNYRNDDFFIPLVSSLFKRRREGKSKMRIATSKTLQRLVIAKAQPVAIPLKTTMDSHVTSLLTMTFLPSSFWARYESRNRLLIANKRLPHLRLAMTGVQKRDCYEQNYRNDDILFLWHHSSQTRTIFLGVVFWVWSFLKYQFWF